MRLLAALFTTRPMTFTDVSSTGTSAEKARAGTDISKSGRLASTTQRSPAERAEDVVGILAAIVPNLGKILVEPDRVLSAANTISTNVIGPTFRAKAFPETVSRGTLALLQELSRLPNFQKTWKKDVSDAFNDARFFGTSDLSLVRTHWLPLLLQWSKADKDRLPELLGRITAPTTAGIVFGVGATSARLEADRRTQLNLRRIATLILASPVDAFAAELPQILDKLVELLGASPTSSPSSTTRAEVYLVLRALVLRTSAVHLAPLWPTVNAELHAALTSVVAPDHSAASDTYGNASVLQACKLLDLLLAAAPDDFQLHEWLFITDSVDAVYRTSPASSSHVVALADELSEELGAVTLTPLTAGPDSSASAARMRGMSDAVPYVVGAAAQAQSTAPRRTMLLGRGPGMISDDVSLERRDELVAKVLRPFFAQLSIFAFESTYAMGTLDRDACVQAVLRDLFDERTIVRAL